MVEQHPTQSSVRPLVVDRRLADGHRLWHQAEAAYFDPDGFRLSIQNAIQTLRSVTFILQRHKESIPNFDKWYGDYVDEKHGKRGKWQVRLHADPLMRWMVEARNRIEKQGDLEANSIIRAEIIASYLDEGPRMKFRLRFFTPARITSHYPRGSCWRAHQAQWGASFQRRWGRNTLPEYVTSRCNSYRLWSYGTGSARHIVRSDYRRPRRFMMTLAKADEPPADDDGGRVSCTLAHNLPRAAEFALADGSHWFEEKEFRPSLWDPRHVLRGFPRRLRTATGIGRCCGRCRSGITSSTLRDRSRLTASL